MRTSTAYFAGVGTVVAALAAGVGGGLLISNVVSPHAPKAEMSKLELRMSDKPIPATNASSEPLLNAAPAQEKPAKAQTEENAPASAPPQTAARLTQAATSEQQVKTPESAFAKASDAGMRARDADVKARDADVRREARRAAEEKRKAERRQQWVERRRHLQRRDQELREVEAQVREDTEPRQVFASEQMKLENPRVRLFDPE
jgi:hypothetical protein